jgi:hypothetical protein
LGIFFYVLWDFNGNRVNLKAWEMRLSTLLLLGAGLRRIGAAAAATEEDVRLESREEDLRLLERGLADTIWDDIKNGASCTGCEVRFFERSSRIRPYEV